MIIYVMCTDLYSIYFYQNIVDLYAGIYFSLSCDLFC